jgi:hypothetical protein
MGDVLYTYTDGDTARGTLKEHSLKIHPPRQTIWNDDDDDENRISVSDIFFLYRLSPTKVISVRYYGALQK